MNKKLIFNLLGGGVTIAVASFGGIKAKNTINLKGKIVHYEKINKLIKANRGSYWQELDLPQYANSDLWQKIHANKIKNLDFEQSKQNFIKKFPNALSFRDYCYKEAESDTQLKKCEEHYNSWCEECLIGQV